MKKPQTSNAMKRAHADLIERADALEAEAEHLRHEAAKIEKDIRRAVRGVFREVEAAQ
jgi:hypothetical protein